MPWFSVFFYIFYKAKFSCLKMSFHWNFQFLFNLIQWDTLCSVSKLERKLWHLFCKIMLFLLIYDSHTSIYWTIKFNESTYFNKLIINKFIFVSFYLSLSVFIINNNIIFFYFHFIFDLATFLYFTEQWSQNSWIFFYFNSKCTGQQKFGRQKFFFFVIQSYKLIVAAKLNIKKRIPYSWNASNWWHPLVMYIFNVRFESHSQKAKWISKWCRDLVLPTKILNLRTFSFLQE